jgi:hypothetical protein
MGTSGHRLFDDDFALDVRDAYIEALRDGLDSQQATNSLLGQFAAALEDSDEAAVFWLALAETQWNLGRLIDDVRARAVEAVDTGASTEWGDLQKQRAAELARIRKKLLSDQPRSKRLPKGMQKVQSGDVFRFAHSFEGHRVHFYGRVIVDHHAAFYTNSALDHIARRRVQDAHRRGELPRPEDREFKLEDVKLLDVAFIGSCYGGFAAGKYRLLGNVPLEDKFKQPLYFYHRAVGDDVCRVFDIWRPREEREVDIAELDPRIERWSALGHYDVLLRLGLPVKA